MTFEQVQRRLDVITQREMELAENPPFVRITPDMKASPLEYEVVWNGGELLPDRESVEDDRLRYVPSYDLDDGEASRNAKGTRKYTFTGKHTNRGNR